MKKTREALHILIQEAVDEENLNTNRLLSSTTQIMAIVDKLIETNWVELDEPREFWLAVHEEGKWVDGMGRIVDVKVIRGSRKEVERVCPPSDGYEIIHVREVLND